MRNFVLTSNSVTDGHPDKLCDLISDAIVDHYLALDPDARVNAECAIASGIVFLAAHTFTSAHADLPAIVRGVVRDTGYRDPDFNPSNVTVLSTVLPFGGGDAEAVGRDRPTVSSSYLNTTVFGYACVHTDEMLPFSIVLAHRLVRRLKEARVSETIPGLHPDGQAQVAVRYRDRKPAAIEGVTLFSARSDTGRADPQLNEILKETVVGPVLTESDVAVSKSALIDVNPPESFMVGGPTRHAGLTGRKNDIDTYGGFSRHGGAALSGKDPSRTDRIGAYAARYAAKNIVAAGLADECEVQISYTTGRPDPVSVEIDTFGSSEAPESQIREAFSELVDLNVDALSRRFDLHHLPKERGGRFFADLAVLGHVGRPELHLPWEATDVAQELKAQVQLG